MSKKIREYSTANRPAKLYCPSCHREVNCPITDTSKVSGTINLGCGHCTKGMVVLKGENAKK